MTPCINADILRDAAVYVAAAADIVYDAQAVRNGVGDKRWEHIVRNAKARQRKALNRVVERQNLLKHIERVMQSGPERQPGRDGKPPTRKEYMAARMAARAAQTEGGRP